MQVIDDAINCTYSIFALTDKEFELIFPDGRDIEFADELFERLGDDLAARVINPAWSRPVAKAEANGIHGTIFYQCPEKKQFYPTRKSLEFKQHGDDL
ncbi:hypothetical protein [Pinirhizobacter soli]|uniref:hypothetical protein n=1 Tax=Pinirhizobacter soli TaxID=2786953 RepID=UPI002029C71A|nr:hypothetical protein [Pinirhizobacter soli]